VSLNAPVTVDPFSTVVSVGFLAGKQLATPKLNKRQKQAFFALGGTRDWVQGAPGGKLRKAKIRVYQYAGQPVQVAQVKKIIRAGGVVPAPAKRPADPGYRPDLTEPRLPPLNRPPPPPPPPSRPPNAPRKGPLGGPGSIRGQIVGYVVANGILWGITKAGEWIRQRAATAAEIERGAVEGGGPRRGGRRGPAPASEQLSPIQIFQKRLPVPRVRPVLRPAPPPIVKQPTLEPVVITAQRIPVPVPVKPVPTWLKILKAIPAGTNPLSLLQGGKASKSSKQLGRALTALEARGVSSVLTQSSFSGFSSFGGTPGKVGTKTCECKPKRKKKPKVPREICYTGTYTERADGLSKVKRRKVPCRSSRK
jgi:hypothetical protein